jgi:hypothetical protein
MAQWPTGWQHTTLRACGIPVTQFALDVLNAWQQSTPTAPWTGNPLGMPGSSAVSVLSPAGKYRTFITMRQFRDEFKRFLKSSKGKGIYEAILMGQSYSDAWREIHALCWPGNDTESEYPIKLMDMVEAAYTSKQEHKTRDIPKTSGQTHAPPDVHDAMRKQSHLLYQAAKHFSDASTGIAHIMKGMNPHG